MTSPDEVERARDEDATFDAIVIGAGIAGLYALHRLRETGRPNVRVYESGDGVGGTWYWNRYPGARCDAESLAYSMSLSPELDQEWEWSKRYATQPEILRYIEHVAERFDLARDIRFERRVTQAHWDGADWRVETDAGDRARAPLLICATGCLSVPKVPDLSGVDDFAGPTYVTGRWPHEGVDFRGRRVGLVGTGSSAIQAIPVIAEQADELTVFQRTLNFSVPAHNHALDPDWVRAFKARYPEHRRMHKAGLSGGFGDLEIVPKPRAPLAESALALEPQVLEAVLEKSWAIGGARFISTIGDALLDERANALVADFVHRKIRGIVRDAETADALCPKSHPIGTKRICVDTGYFEAFNRENVRLVDLRKQPIESVTEHGIRTTAETFAFDDLVLATGFDAMTGALLAIDIRGEGGRPLADAWREGPKSYLGLMIAGFPNLFTITGPGSPSVLSNVIVSIEQHVDFVIDCVAHRDANGAARIDADPDAQEQWVAHVREVADATLMPKGGSWYLGANVPGKPRVFMPYAAGVAVYREVCEGVAADDYRGFTLSGNAP